jgi:hypothetical protein
VKAAAPPEGYLGFGFLGASVPLGGFFFPPVPGSFGGVLSGGFGGGDAGAAAVLALGFTTKFSPRIPLEVIALNRGRLRPFPSSPI